MLRKRTVLTSVFQNVTNQGSVKGHSLSRYQQEVTQLDQLSALGSTI